MALGLEHTREDAVEGSLGLGEERCCHVEAHQSFDILSPCNEQEYGRRAAGPASVERRL